MTGLVLIFSLLATLAPTDQKQFQVGLEAYWSGDYTAATRQFEALTKVAPMMPSVWYNYGTSLAESGQTGLAVYALERALLLSPGDSDALKNLRRVKTRAIEALSASEQDRKLVLPALERSGTSLFRLYQKDTLNWLFGLCWFLYFIALWLAREGRRARIRTLGFFFSLVFFLLSAGVATLRLGRAYWVDQTKTAIVTQPMSEARQGPGQQYRSQTRILDGVKVKVLGEQEDWILIEYASGRTAWILRSGIKTLPFGS